MSNHQKRKKLDRFQDCQLFIRTSSSPPSNSIKNHEDTFSPIEFFCDSQKLFRRKKKTPTADFCWHWRTVQWILMRIYVNIMLEKCSSVAFINLQSEDPFSLTQTFSASRNPQRGHLFFADKFVISNWHIAINSSWRVNDNDGAECLSFSVLILQSSLSDGLSESSP